MSALHPQTSAQQRTAGTDLIEYHGNVPYCYANSVSMLLSVQGEQVAPGLIEVLTGIGLGAVRVDGGPAFFSTTPSRVPPGIDQALTMLGFAYTSTAGPEDAPVQELLRADLAHGGPVMLGPLDMGYLTYIPWHGPAAGSDHYVVAYAIDGERVYLQDPAGFPCTSLGFDDLTHAWRAERIGYRGGAYQRWLNLHRVRQPTDRELYDQALVYFRSVYRDQPNWGPVTGPQAIRQLATEVRAGGAPEGLAGFLVNFSLPLGARRALDYARFFAQGGDADLASLKQAQAQLFGDGLVATTRADWGRLAGVLDGLADREAELERAFSR